MQTHFVERLLVHEPASVNAGTSVRYSEADRVNVAADGTPFVEAAPSGELATLKTMDIDTRTIKDRGPEE